MIPFRHWFCTSAAGFCAVAGVWAQESPDPSASPPTTAADAAAVEAQRAPFPVRETAPEPTGGAGASEKPAQGAAASSTSASSASSEEPTFTLPALYGGATQVFTGGTGRLAKPRFIYRVFTSAGYDDNVFQTPTKTRATPEVSQQVLVLGPDNIPRIGTVVLAPARPAAKRIGSPVNQAGAAMEVQIFSSRSLFTFNLSGSGSYYWNRPGIRKVDYNGSLVLGYLYRLTPRLQFSAQVNAAYLSQPDFSRINSPQRQTGQNYLSANSRFDLSYRWTPRLSAILSLTDNVLEYQTKTLAASNYNETILGTEVRYLWSPVLTGLTEVRYGSIMYADAPERDSHTMYGLVGLEARLGPRLSAVLRAGESIRSFTESGKSASTPYMEAAAGYRVGPATQLSVTARYGFEEPLAAGQDRTVFRTGIGLHHAFSARLSSDVAINLLDENSSAAGLKTHSDTIDANLRMDYRVTRDFSLNASYSYTQVVSAESLGGYYRNRLFIGAQYNF